jgi:heat shock protein HtpX
MINIYEQERKNKNASFLIIFLFVIFITLSAWLITVGFDLPLTIAVYALIFSVISSLSAYNYGDKLVLSMHHAIVVNKKQYPIYYSVTENMAMVKKIPLPKLFIIKSNALNAFATGKDPQHSSVCVTTGLLEKLNRTQLEGVIAHELSHIQNYDSRLFIIVSLLIGSLSLLINLGTRYSIFNRRSNDRDTNPIFAIVGLILIIFSPIIAKLIQLAISRKREYLADAMAVKSTKQPNGLIEALTIISEDKNKFETASTSTNSLYISNPFKKEKMANLFSTHPPIQDRIKVLSKML